MATNITTDIWEFDAPGEGDGATGADSPTYNHYIYVKQFVFVDDGTNHGHFRILNKNGGVTIAKARTTTELQTITIDVNKWVSGVYVNNMPTGGAVLVYTGRR